MVTRQLKSLLASVATAHAAVILKQVDESLCQAAASATLLADRTGRIEEEPITALGRSTVLLRTLAAHITAIREELASRGALIAAEVEGRHAPEDEAEREHVAITDEMLDELLRSGSQR